MVSEPPLPKRKKTFSKTSRSVHSEEQQPQNIINQAMSVLSRPDDEYDGLGKTYAAKLRRMPAAQRDIADKLITDVLFKGLQSSYPFDFYFWLWIYIWCLYVKWYTLSGLHLLKPNSFSNSSKLPRTGPGNSVSSLLTVFNIRYIYKVFLPSNIRALEPRR